MKEYVNGLMEDLGAEIGFEATTRLVAVYGGHSLYVPGAATPEHPLAKLIGEMGLHRLCKAFGGEVLTVPENAEFERLRRVRQVAGLLRQGHKTGVVAALLGISDRQVANYRTQAESLGLLSAVLIGSGKPKAPLPEQAPLDL